MNQFTKNNYHYFFFITVFIIQIFIFNDYGFSNDEELSRTNGLVSYNYILEKLNIGKDGLERIVVILKMKRIDS